MKYLGAIIAERPIIILGCPRSGTLLVSRILGQPARHFLITEHKNKGVCPEDQGVVSDNELWWQNCKFKAWDNKNNRPLVERPIFTEENISAMSKVYIDRCQSSRLVIKNPQHVTRVPFLKAMFPDAQFVFCVRNPWHTLQSMSIKEFRLGKFRDKGVLRTDKNLTLPEDQLRRAAHSWGFAIDAYLKEKDESWIALRYEDLLSEPNATVSGLFQFLSINDASAMEKAVTLPHSPESNFYPVKTMFATSNLQNEVISDLKLGCKVFDYEVSPDSLPSDVKSYNLKLAKLKNQRPKIKRLWNRLISKLEN